jgi:hypothetical protein
MRTILLKASLAFLATPIRVYHAADCSNVTRLELGDCRADFNDTANDLMSRNTWIDSWYRSPLVTNGVEVRVTNTAEKNFDLNVMLAWITPWDHNGRKRRHCIRSRVSLCFILAT